jgi:hypothetical protein
VDKLPTQLKWDLFTAALKRLGLKKLPNKRGAARHFQRLSDGEVFTFHEPHGNDTIRQGTLTEYLRKLNVTREELEAALYPSSQTSGADDLFKRTIEADGTIISNCTKCLNVVFRSKLAEEVAEAEAAHACP